MKLGPILGIESEYRYTVCFLSKTKYAPTKLSLQTTSSIDNTETKHIYDCCIKLQQHYFYRFSFDVAELDSAHTISYALKAGAVQLIDSHARDSWEFEVPGKDKMPKVGFCSCNGDSSAHPSKIQKSEYLMWRKMKKNHAANGEKFHLLLMGGDQVYADSLWEEVVFLKNLKIQKTAGLSNAEIRKKNRDLKKLTTNAVAEYRLTKTQEKTFTRELKDFYEQLYIDSWADEAMSYMLASVPCVMMWDDHDIFDGWGSRPAKLQKSDIFKNIFPVAKEYFETFQIRTRRNTTLMSARHFSMQLTLRNMEIVVLDNRSYRSLNQVMSKGQYKDLQKALDKPLFKTIPSKLAKEKVLCLVVPVPVAHLNYSELAEKLMGGFRKNDFRHAFSDDLIDHWDHSNHETEQKDLLDRVFAAGEKHDAKYVCIVSGDVHSAGAATITDKQSKRKITQLISSAAVHIPPTRVEALALNAAGAPKSEVAGYILDLKNYGTVKKATINRRNFGYLTKAKRGGVVSTLCIERKKDLAFRTLNKFKGGRGT